MTRRLTRAAACAVLLAAAATACNNGVTDTLLEAVDPDLIAPANLRSAEGAQAAYVGTFYRFNAALAGQNADTVGAFLWGGLLADEWCGDARQEWFKPGTEPTAYASCEDTYYRSVNDEDWLNEVRSRIARSLRRIIHF